MEVKTQNLPYISLQHYKSLLGLYVDRIKRTLNIQQFSLNAKTSVLKNNVQHDMVLQLVYLFLSSLYLFTSLGLQSVRCCLT